MMGLDEENALLQMVRADLSVKRKNIIAKEQSEAAEAAAYRFAQPAFLYA